MPTRTLLQQQIDFFLLNYFKIHHHHDDPSHPTTSFSCRTPSYSVVTPPARGASPSGKHSRHGRTATSIMLATRLPGVLLWGLFKPGTCYIRKAYAHLPACPPKPPWQLSASTKVAIVASTRLCLTITDKETITPTQPNRPMVNMVVLGVSTRYCPSEIFSQMPRPPSACHIRQPSSEVSAGAAGCTRPSSLEVAALKKDPVQQLSSSCNCRRCHRVTRQRLARSSGSPLAILILLQNVPVSSCYIAFRFPSTYYPLQFATMTTRPSRKSPSSLLSATKASSARTRFSSRLALAASGANPANASDRSDPTSNVAPNPPNTGTNNGAIDLDLPKPATMLPKPKLADPSDLNQKMPEVHTAEPEDVAGISSGKTAAGSGVMDPTLEPTCAGNFGTTDTDTSPGVQPMNGTNTLTTVAEPKAHVANPAGLAAAPAKAAGGAILDSDMDDASPVSAAANASKDKPQPDSTSTKVTLLRVSTPVDAVGGGEDSLASSSPTLERVNNSTAGSEAGLLNVASATAYVEPAPPTGDATSSDAAGTPSCTIKEGVDDASKGATEVVNVAGADVPAFTTPTTVTAGAGPENASWAVTTAKGLSPNLETNIDSTNPSPPPQILYSIFASKTPSKSPTLTPLGKTCATATNSFGATPSAGVAKSPTEATGTPSVIELNSSARFGTKSNGREPGFAPPTVDPTADHAKPPSVIDATPIGLPPGTTHASFTDGMPPTFGSPSNASLKVGTPPTVGSPTGAPPTLPSTEADLADDAVPVPTTVAHDTKASSTDEALASAPISS